MRPLRLLAPLALALPLWLLTVAAAPATPTPTPIVRPSPKPTPTPTPSTGVLGVTPVEAQPGDKITITGSKFGPGEAVVVYLDTPDKALLSQTADASGGFTGAATVPNDASVADHQLCVGEKPTPVCATLRVLAKSTPTPSPSATPSPTPTPSPSSSSSPAVLPPVSPPGGVSPIATLLEPPFVIFPALILLALLGGAVMWIVYGRRRPAPALPPMRVLHSSPWVDEPEEPGVPAAGSLEAEATGDEPVLPAAPPPEAAGEPPAPRPRTPLADEQPDLPEPGD